MRSFTPCFVLFAVLLPCCADGGLNLTIVRPPGYELSVTQFTLDVLEPPAADWSCSALAFGERTETDLQSVVIASTRLEAGARLGTPLPVRRDVRQLFVAHGFGPDGMRLVSGCATREPGGTLDIAIATVPRVRLDADSPLELFDGRLYGPMPSRLAIDVKDLLGAALADVTVRWSIEGPGAFALDVDTQTDSEGVARLVPELGALGGPYRVRARAPWAEEPRPEIVTFELVDARETALPKPPLQLVTVSAERGGPALVGTLGASECADSAFSAFSLSRNDSFSFPGCALAAGVGVGVADVPTFVVNLVGQPPRVGRLALATGLLEDCGPLPLPADEQSCSATGIYDADPCGRSGRALVVFSCPTGESTTVTRAHTFDVATCDVTDRGGQGLAVTAAARAVERVGCLDVDNSPRNAVVAREDSRDLLFLEESPTLARRVKGVTQFYDFGQEGTSHVLLGLGSNGDRLRVVSFRTRIDPESDNLLADTAAAFDVPVRPLTGSVADLDGDGLVDLFGLTRGGDAQTRSVLLCLGRGSTSPICALGFELRTEGRDLAVATDLDGDRVFDFLGADFAGVAWRIVSNSLVRGVR